MITSVKANSAFNSWYWAPILLSPRLAQEQGSSEELPGWGRGLDVQNTQGTSTWGTKTHGRGCRGYEAAGGSVPSGLSPAGGGPEKQQRPRAFPETKERRQDRTWRSAEQKELGGQGQVTEGEGLTGLGMEGRPRREWDGLQTCLKRKG